MQKYTTVRIKTAIKELLDKISNHVDSSVPEVLEKIVKESGYDNEIDVALYLDDVIFNLCKDRADKRTAATLQLLYRIWKQVTPDKFQETGNYIEFITIENFIVADIAAHLYTDKLLKDSAKLNEKEIDQRNCALYAKNMIFSNKYLGRYCSIVVRITKDLDPYKYSYICKDRFVNLLILVLQDKEMNELLNEYTVKQSFLKVKEFIKLNSNSFAIIPKNIAYETRIHTNTSNMKTNIIKLIESDYNIDLINEEDLGDIIKLSHNMLHACNDYIISEPIISIIKIAHVCYIECKEQLNFDDGYNNYLLGNLGRIKENIEDSMQYYIDKYHNEKLIYNLSAEMLIRTPFQIIESANNTKIPFFRNKKIFNTIKKNISSIVSFIAANYANNGGYWYHSIKIKEFGFKTDSMIIKSAPLNNRVYITATYGDFTTLTHYNFLDFYKMVLVLHSQQSDLKNLSKEFQISYDKENGMLRITNQDSNLLIDKKSFIDFKTQCILLLENQNFIESRDIYFKYYGIA